MLGVYIVDVDVHGEVVVLWVHGYNIIVTEHSRHGRYGSPIYAKGCGVNSAESALLM